MVLGIALAMYYEWSLGLVAIAFMPVILISMYLQRIVMEQENMGNAKTMENTTKLAAEVVSNIRTVVSLAREDMFHKTYIELLTPAVVVSSLRLTMILDIPKWIQLLIWPRSEFRVSPSRIAFSYLFSLVILLEIEKEYTLSWHSLWPGQISYVLRLCRLHVLRRLVRGQSRSTNGRCVQVSKVNN